MLLADTVTVERDGDISILALADPKGGNLRRATLVAGDAAVLPFRSGWFAQAVMIVMLDHLDRSARTTVKETLGC
jgi:hypothetical protein